jgi:hypothetical protein
MILFTLFIKKIKFLFIALRTGFFQIFDRFLAFNFVNNFFSAFYKKISPFFFHQEKLRKIENDGLMCSDPNFWYILYAITINSKVYFVYGFTLGYVTTVAIDFMWPVRAPKVERLASFKEIKAIVEVGYQHLEEPQIETTPEQALQLEHIKVRGYTALIAGTIGFTVGVFVQACWHFYKIPGAWKSIY